MKELDWGRSKEVSAERGHLRKRYGENQVYAYRRL